MPNVFFVMVLNKIEFEFDFKGHDLSNKIIYLPSSRKEPCVNN